MAHLHVKLVDAILASSKIEGKDQDFVRKYLSDFATLTDETELARRVLSSSRVITTLLEELSDEQDAARPSPAAAKGTELRDYISQDVVYHFSMPSSMANDKPGTGDDDPAENESHFSGIEPGMRLSPLTLPGKKADSFSSSGDSSVISANEYGNALNKIKQEDPVSEDNQELKKAYPFGHKLMSSYGWTPDQGLGPDGDGIKQPVPGDSSPTPKRYDSNPGVGHASGETSNAPGKQSESFPGQERDVKRSSYINKPKASQWYKPDKRKHQPKRAPFPKRSELRCAGNPLPDTAPQGEEDDAKPDLFDKSAFYPKGVDWAACEANYTRDEWSGGGEWN
ncbi:hypothetical protein F5X96DRAFT_669760 [Biscogniauxia mediterranea]|nr:hypothetical protein F5X96DRAFT_669760 [Biscogniauxia mediterranea]